MNKKLRITLNQLSVITLLVLTCISCAHQRSNESAAFDGADAADQHIWADTKDVGDAVAGEEVSQEEKSTAPDMSAETVATNDKEVTAGVTEVTKPILADDSQKKSDEAGMDAMLTAAENTETAKVEAKTEEVVAPITVARVDNPKEDTAIIADSTIAQTPQDTFQSNKDIYTTDKREIASEAKAETSAEPQNNNVPSIAVPSEVKDVPVPSSNKRPGKRSSTPHNTQKRVEATQPPNVTPKVNQDTQAKVNSAPPPVAVAKKEMEESFGHEPIPGKQQTADDDEATDAQLASVEIANFIEHHVVTVIIGIVGFIAGLYFFMRRNKENDNNSI